MENSEKPLYIYPTGKIDDIVLRASEKNEFREIVKGAEGKLEAIKKVRQLLPQSFPETETLPQAERTGVSNRVGVRFRSLTGSPLSNDYLVARG